ncbi:phosphoribosylanthranilate isomerase [Ferruginibacter yonginensis]|uniref:N-(5'-phosphoribosyl)anthranilate isomerase n=1 Tax=Ferruginibacter yonginensis TaxID=1310416 RepID=A0ABV8QN57_9BACT
MNIKVCGITSKKQLQQLDGLNVAYAGFIFYEKSPRYAGLKLANEDLTEMDLDVKKVGVFVDAEYEDIMEMVEKYELDMVQLHGNESPELCEELSEDVEVIKAFSITDTTTSIDTLVAPYDNVCDYYLFDAASKTAKGGTGTKFDWKKITDSKIEKPFFLSGGIGPDDVTALKKFKHPDFFGIDVNSQFEKEPGVKDMGAVLKFVHDLK